MSKVKMTFAPKSNVKLASGKSVLKALQGSNAAATQARAEMKGYGARVRTKASTYPPEPGGSKYDRSGNLGRLWANDTKIAPNKITTTVSNSAEYAEWVVGDKQRGFHRAHGWLNVRQVAETEWEHTLKRLQEIFGG